MTDDLVVLAPQAGGRAGDRLKIGLDSIHEAFDSRCLSCPKCHLTVEVPRCGVSGYTLRRTGFGSQGHPHAHRCVDDGESPLHGWRELINESNAARLQVLT